MASPEVTPQTKVARSVPEPTASDPVGGDRADDQENDADDQEDDPDRCENADT